ncbi:hypothetical protein MBGDF03_00490 [Thermoplasmatales archaeon SCGC AB-540-F20]|nr:hypothetical protein MBGDF03_00490 [Thermoplasmatales archaeon SCGC AB-540-F20]
MRLTRIISFALKRSVKLGKPWSSTTTFESRVNEVSSKDIHPELIANNKMMRVILMACF